MPWILMKQMKLKITFPKIIHLEIHRQILITGVTKITFWSKNSKYSTPA